MLDAEQTFPTEEEIEMENVSRSGFNSKIPKKTLLRFF